MIPVVEHILQQGCGITLSQLLTGDAYQHHLARLSQSFAPRSPQAIARRVGVQQFGMLLNITPTDEQAVLTAAEELPDIEPPNLELWAMVAATGDALITAADSCLTEEMIAWADEWSQPTTTTERQLEITQALFNHLTNPSQVEDGEMNFSVALKQLNHERVQWFELDMDRILPKRYGIWHPDTCKANCQGVTQILLAFARRAGCQALTIHPVKSKSSILDDWQKQIVGMINQDFAQRGIRYIDRLFQESSAAQELFDRLKMPYDHFHVGALLQLKDASWVVVDPFGLTWGPLTAHYDINRVLRTLNCYGDALPGLSLMAADTHTPQKLQRRLLATVNDLLAISAECEAALARRRLNCAAIIDAAINTRLFSLFKNPHGYPEELHTMIIQAGLLQLMEGIHDPELERRSLDDEMELAFYLMTIGPKIVYFDQDQELLRRIHDSIITMPHSDAVNLIRAQQLSHDGELIHPVMEFNQPAFQIGLSALNTISHGLGCDIQPFLATATNDQLTLTNSITVQIPAHQQAAAQIAQRLPWRHSGLEFKLNGLPKE